MVELDSMAAPTGKSTTPYFAASTVFSAGALEGGGNPAKVTRTIEITAKETDEGMTFEPADFQVKKGETVRFVVHNDGQVMHEMVIGSLSELKEHAELMRKFPNMEHDEPYMTHVPPGKKGEIVWQFTRAGEFHYACLIPGHMEAGMIAKITVK